MSHRLVILSLLVPLIAPALLAQGSADIRGSIQGVDTTVDARQGFTWTLAVLNEGPDTAHGIVLTVSSQPPLASSCSANTIDTLTLHQTVLLQCSTAAPGARGDITLHAHIDYGNDPNPFNNDPTRMVRAVAGPDLGLLVGMPVIDPGLQFDIGFYLYNGSKFYPASNVTATATLPPQIRVLRLPDNCTQSGQVVTCAAGTVPANQTNPVTPAAAFTAIVDDSANGQMFPVEGDVTTTDIDEDVTTNHTNGVAQVFRTFFVTDTAPDSLAAAIDQANLGCTDEYPCKIAFRLGTPPEAGYFTLKPQRALPKITGKTISIDGTTQTRLTGDTNPTGPEVFIDGSDNAWEDAIVIDEPCAAEITGLAIGNFKNAAVTTNGAVDPVTGTVPCASLFEPRIVHDNYLGVDPSGTRAAANGRGVVINERLFSATAINKNLISGNQRSGIWVGNTVRNEIANNTIGIDIHHQPLANGGSGIYVSPSASVIDISGNYIAFNHDFGIAVDRNARDIGIGPNSIFANWQLGIDVGLDGPTPDRDIPAPIVLSAQYDPATNTTLLTISSRQPPDPVLGILPTLSMYASDAPHPSGYGDGQYYLGSITFGSTKGDVHFAAAGDWRGKWVSATVTRNELFDADAPYVHKSTSEFSHSVKVE